MNMQTYTFNAHYLDDIYGVCAVSHGDTYYCKLVKYHVGLSYKPRIMKAFEKELTSNSRFREDFFGGWVVLLKIPEKEVIRCRVTK